MKDYEVIDAFIKYLREHGHPELTISCRPEKENDTKIDAMIDAIAGPLAIEHTSIDISPDQRRNSDLFNRAVGGLHKEFSGQLSFHLTINFYDGSIERGRNCKKIRQAFKNWIREEKDNPHLTEGVHWIHNVPGIPFRFQVIKEYDSAPGVSFGRLLSDRTNLPDRIKELLNRKAEKLKPYQDSGKTTVLLIESYSIALTDIQGRVILDAIRDAYPISLPVGVDQIWYVDTAELPIFKDFTSDLLMK